MGNDQTSKDDDHSPISCPCEHTKQHRTTDDVAHIDAVDGCDHHTTLTFTHTKPTDEQQLSIVVLPLLAPPSFLPSLHQLLNEAIPPPRWPLVNKSKDWRFAYLKIASRCFPRA